MSSPANITNGILTVTRSRDESFLLTLERSDVELDEGAIAGVVFCVKRLPSQSDEDAPVRLTLGAGLTRLADADASTLKIRVEIPRARLAPLSPLITYFWDVAVQDGDGALRAVRGLAGRFVVESAIAQSAT